MALAHYIGYIENTSTGKPLPSVVVLVYSAAGGVLQPVFADLSGTAKPLVESDDNGGYDFYIADGNYDIEHVYNGVVRNRISNIAIFNPDNYAAGGDLAGTGGAALVGTANGDTVQEYLDSIDSRLSEVSVGTFVEAQLAVVPVTVGQLVTTGRNSAGDGGAATYVRWAAPMAALIANQEGYSWFESADGAQWTLIDVEVRPEMFGAMGHATNDEGLAIRRMFEHATGKTVLITKTHRYKSQTAGVDDIRIYSNTRVQGVSALTCGFKRIPNTLGEAMATPAYGVWCQDADEVYISDIFHDVQRSGLGQPSATNQRVNGLLVRGRNGRVRVERMIVLNATGYAFYQGAVAADHSTDVVMTDCTAINSQVSFELTGKDSAWRLERPRSLQYVTDGGAVVPPECGYHQYGGVGAAYHDEPYHRGGATAVLAVLTDAFENQNVEYKNSDFEISIPALACAIVRNDNFGANGKLSQARFIGGRIVNTNGPASDFAAALVDVNDAQFIGRTAALGVGPNSIVALSGDFDIQCIEPITTPSGSAALAAVIDAAATATRTPTGSITATHLNGGAEVAVFGDITLVDDTFIDPPIGGGVLGTEAPRHIQRLRGFKVEGPSGITDFINAGGNVYWASMTLGAIPTGWTASSQNTDFDKVIVSASLELAGQAGVVSTVPHGIHWYRRPGVSVPEVFFVINSTAALPAGTRLRYDIIEEA